MNEEVKTLFGIPVIESEAVPIGTVLVGRLPTENEIREHGSFEKAVQAQARQWYKITGIASE